MEFSEDRELVAVRSGFVPFTDTSGVNFMEPLLTETPSDVGAEGEGLFGVPDDGDLENSGWTGGRGAWYLIRDACD